MCEVTQSEIIVKNFAKVRCSQQKSYDFKMECFKHCRYAVSVISFFLSLGAYIGY